MEEPKRWGPDTCACRVYHAVDPDTGTDRFINRAEAVLLHEAMYLARPASVNNPASHPLPPVVLCPFHAALGDLLPRYNTLLAENRRKNTTLSIAQSVRATLTPEDFRWSFDGSRTLLVTFAVSLTTNQRNNIQAACDVQFGPGRVVVA